jgi:hypothetical protein
MKEDQTQNAIEQVGCRRCGRCCYFIVGDGVRKCRFLIRHGKLTSCRIYSNRLGKIHDEVDGIPHSCTLRSKGEYDYPGCPLNTNKQMFPKVIPDYEQNKDRMD